MTSIIVRGTGKRITKAERDAYPEDVPVFFQPKAWLNDNVLGKWCCEYVCGC